VILSFRHDFSVKLQGQVFPSFQFKVIPFNCIAHPFCASFFAWLARARARASLELDRFSMKAGQFREITGPFLLNELCDPHFFRHKFKWHIAEYNISRFQETLKILLWDIFNQKPKRTLLRYSRVCTHATNSLIFFHILNSCSTKIVYNAR